MSRAPLCQDVSLAGTREPQIVSLFSGYGGLEMGIQSVLGGHVLAHVEFDAAPSQILAHRYPGVPNLGDITAVDWAAFLAEHPELGGLFGTYRPGVIVCGGFPCQDLSLAGRRAGMRPGTRSGLWADFLKAIDVLRPELAVIENVRGLLSGCAESEADSDRGPCPRCADPKSGAGHAPNVRALGRVLIDLASIGYDARWVGLRAADAGAPHARFRVFVLARPSNPTDNGRSVRITGRLAARLGAAPRDRDAAADAGGEALGLGTGLRPSEPAGLGRGRSDDDGVSDPAADAARLGWREDERGLLAGEPDPSRRSPAPPDAAGRGRDGRPQDEVGEARERAAAARRGRGADAAADASGERLGEHPGESSAEEAGPRGRDVADGAGGSRPDQDWGPYRSAVERWERCLGRRAPNPTRPDGKAGANRLSPLFVEWMMGLPEGWVTSAEVGLTRAQQLKALGNGVVPQQAALAVATLLEAEAVAA